MGIKTNKLRVLFVVFFLGCLGLVMTGVASALTYQQEIGVNFTFNQSLGITLSTDDLHIYNLAPGSASDSNVINVKVLTNSINGYTLNATVGNDTTYNTRNLIHSNSNISDNFASIAYSASPTITTNTNIDTDKWAFSFSVDNGTNWSNYNGLPLYSDTTNIATLKTSSGPSVDVNGDDIKFKIAAKASESKPSGDYHNVINFNVVAAPTTMDFAAAFESAGKTRLLGYYQMQDMTGDICSAVEVEEDEIQLIDNRDNKVYWVAKLADGNCWMTQNLDHDIITDTNFYTYNNTDIGHGPTTNTSATWTATRATYATTSTQTSEWCAGGASDTQYGYYRCINQTPESYDPGNLYWNGTLVDYLTNWNTYGSSCDMSVSPPTCDQSLNPISTFASSTGTAQYHLGNYYNWAAALAMNSTSTYTGTELVEQSICPAGWTLPRAGTGEDSFAALWTEYGFSNGSFSSLNDAIGSPMYFNLSGGFDGTLTEIGNIGYYNSPVAGYSSDALRAIIDPSGAASSTSYILRGNGFSIRCIARPVSATATGF